MQSPSSTLLALLVVDLVAAMTPGPNFFLVSQLSLASGRKKGMSGVLGILTGNVIWATGVALGLGALFTVMPVLYKALKFAGGLYLIYLGLKLWREAEGHVAERATSETAPYVRGLATTIMNPKCLLYFGSVFTLILRPEAPRQVLVVGILIVAFNTVLWYGGIAFLFSHEEPCRLYRSVRSRINRLAGAVIAGFGLKLVLDAD